VSYAAISILLTTGAFALLYVAVPNRLVDWRDAAWGGLLAALAFEVAKRLFAFFIARFPTYTMIYGALAAMPIFLVWVYLSWLITLVGAVLAAALPIVKYERWWHVPAPGSVFVDAMSILRVLSQARLSDASAALDAATIRNGTRLGFDEIESLLQSMLDAGWVGRIKVETPRALSFGKRPSAGLDRWTLLANPEQLKLADVYRLFVFQTSGHNALARKVETAIEQGLNQTLAAHFKAD
jgi:membrane protein